MRYVYYFGFSASPLTNMCFIPLTINHPYIVYFIDVQTLNTYESHTRSFKSHWIQLSFIAIPFINNSTTTCSLYRCLIVLVDNLIICQKPSMSTNEVSIVEGGSLIKSASSLGMRNDACNSDLGKVELYTSDLQFFFILVNSILILGICFNILY